MECDFSRIALLAYGILVIFVKTKGGKYEVITSRDDFDFSAAVFAMVDICLVLLQSDHGSLYGSYSGSDAKRNEKQIRRVCS